MEDGEPSYAFYGDGAADTQLTPAELPEALFETRPSCTSARSACCGQHPAGRGRRGGGLARARLLSFDPNLRPGLVRDEPPTAARSPACSGWPTWSSSARPTARGWRPASRWRRCRRSAGHGPALVLVTRGGRGALALRAGEAVGGARLCGHGGRYRGRGRCFQRGLPGRAGRAWRDQPGGADRPAQRRVTRLPAVRLGGERAHLRAGRRGPATRDEVGRFLAAQPAARERANPRRASRSGARAEHGRAVGPSLACGALPDAARRTGAPPIVKPAALP